MNDFTWMSRARNLGFGHRSEQQAATLMELWVGLDHNTGQLGYRFHQKHTRHHRFSRKVSAEEVFIPPDLVSALATLPRIQTGYLVNEAELIAVRKAAEGVLKRVLHSENGRVGSMDRA